MSLMGVGQKPSISILRSTLPAAGTGPLQAPASEAAQAQPDSPARFEIADRVELRRLIQDPSPLLKKAPAAAVEILFEGQTSRFNLGTLNSENLQAALSRALSSLDTPAIEMTLLAAPVIAGIRIQAPTLQQPTEPAANSFPAFVGASVTGAQVQYVDLPAQTMIPMLTQAVDAEIAAGTLPAEQRNQAIVERFLNQSMAGFAELPAESRQALITLLARIDPAELSAAEIQNPGGLTTGAGVTGVGSEGHYTNSILTSVRELLVNKRLTPAVLTQLGKLSDPAQIHSELQSQQTALLRSALQDIAYPDKINQHAKGTCGAATIQILLAVKDPARYLSLLADLAGPSGRSGELSVEPDTRVADNSGRSISNRLIQPALMEYANDDKDYSNATDLHSDGSNGVFPDGTERLLNVLLPDMDYQLINLLDGKPGGPKPEELIDQIDKATADGEPVPVGMRWGTAGHAILVTKIDKAADKVFYMNPWGELQTMSLFEFTDRIQTAAMSLKPEPGPAMAKIPGIGGAANLYQPIDSKRLFSVGDELRRNPHYKTHFSPELLLSLASVCNALKLPTEYLGYLDQAMAAGLSAETVSVFSHKLMTCRTADDAQKLLQLLSLGAQMSSAGDLSKKLGENDLHLLLASDAHKNLPAADFQTLVAALATGDRQAVKVLIQRALILNPDRGGSVDALAESSQRIGGSDAITPKERNQLENLILDGKLKGAELDLLILDLYKRDMPAVRARLRELATPDN